MIIKNLKLYQTDHTFKEGWLRIENGRIAEVGQGKGTVTKGTSLCHVFDGQGAYAFPGMIDIHFHGCMGADFCDGTMEAIETIASYEASIGVTGIVPATMTMKEEEITKVLSLAKDFAKKQGLARDPAQGQGQEAMSDFLGINMEGPFISPAKKGAQNADHIIPMDVETFKRYQKASGNLVKFIGIAPEEGDFETFIQKVKDTVSVTLAHTNADYDTAKAAFDMGANHATHMYNAMTGMNHREPGVVGAIADSCHVMAEIIGDGIHVHKAVIRNTAKMLGNDRIILISDSMRATGMKDGTYSLGGLDVEVKGKYARLVTDGALAGSVTTLPDCVRTLVKDMGIPLEVAVQWASENPAKSIGVYPAYGCLVEGAMADVVLWDEDFDTKAVFKNGVLV